MAACSMAGKHVLDQNAAGVGLVPATDCWTHVMVHALGMIGCAMVCEDALSYCDVM
jgi:hypothetical protein